MGPFSLRKPKQSWNIEKKWAKMDSDRGHHSGGGGGGGGASPVAIYPVTADHQARVNVGVTGNRELAIGRMNRGRMTLHVYNVRYPYSVLRLCLDTGVASHATTA